MECDECKGDFDPDQILTEEVQLRNGRIDVETCKSMGLGPLLNTFPPHVVSSRLCEQCFGAAYKKFTFKGLTIFSILFLLVDLFIFALMLLGKWDSAVQRNIAGVIGFVVINGGLVLIWVISLRRCQRLKPTPADRSALFTPYRVQKLKLLSQQLTDSGFAARAGSAEVAIDSTVEMFQQMGFTVGGVEAAKRSVRKAAEARPDGPFFDEAVEEILSIYRRHPQGFVQGFGGAPEQELRRLGERLNEIGGKDLMRAAHADFSSRCNLPGAARNLEFVWDGIGSWQG
jgi:hypothetical protein